MNDAPDRLANLRDVAELVDGIRAGVLLRSDAPHVGDEDPDSVVWPPSTVVDTRAPGEASAEHPWAEVCDVRAISVLPDANIAIADGTLAAMYSGFLEGAAAMRVVEVVSTVATAPAPVLIHCSAGKDRTGVSVAVALSLAGAERAHIVADYVATGPNMPGVLARFMRTMSAHMHANGGVAGSELPRELIEAPAYAIEAVLDRLEEHDGGAEGWFIANGGRLETVELLRARLRA